MSIAALGGGALKGHPEVPGNPTDLRHLFRYDRFSSSYCRAALLLTDFIALAASFAVFRMGNVDARLIFYRMLGDSRPVQFNTGVDWFFVVAAGCILYFGFLGHYTQRRLFWAETKDTSRLLGLAALVDLAFLYAVGHTGPVTPILLSWAFAIVALPVGRLATKTALQRLGRWQVPSVIIGAGDNARQTYLALRRQPLLGFDAKLFIDISSGTGPTSLTIGGREVPLVRMPAQSQALLDQLGRAHVIVAVEDNELVRARPLIDRLALHPNQLDIVPPVRGLPLYGLDFRSFFAEDLILLRTRNNLDRRAPRVLKRSLDMLASLLLVTLLAPFFLVVGLLIRRDGGPIIFGHKRVGQNGKHFKCYKFRTMVPNAGQVLNELLDRDPQARAEWEKDFKLKNDPRITRIGDFLRRTSLDELPQLFNVIKGEMSLVGPRPIIDAEIPRYDAHAAYYLQVRPGITGLWQVSGRNDVSYDYRVFLDVWYVKNWSLWTDIVIMLKTIPAVLKKEGAY